MHQAPYVFTRKDSYSYAFRSIGKQEIPKIVTFSQTSCEDVFNLGFGDLRLDGEVDDLVISNNGDIVKIFRTIMEIVKDFTTSNSSSVIQFYGSTWKRTEFYNRILKRYYREFSKDFFITAGIFVQEELLEVPFDPSSRETYVLFFVKKIN